MIGRLLKGYALAKLNTALNRGYVNGRRIPREGEFFSWRTFGGKEYFGVVEEVDSNVLHVRCTDGMLRPVGA